MADLEAGLRAIENVNGDMSSSDHFKAILRAYHGEVEPPEPAQHRIEAGAVVTEDPCDDRRGVVLAIQPDWAWVRWPCGDCFGVSEKYLHVVTPAVVERGDTVGWGEHGAMGFVITKTAPPIVDNQPWFVMRHRSGDKVEVGRKDLTVLMKAPKKT